MTSRERLRIAYVVPDLGIGGAERHVTTLMSSLDRDYFEPHVICIGRRGELFADLVASGVPAAALGRTKRQALTSLLELVRYLRRVSPQVVIVRGFNAEVLGRIAGVLARVPRTIVWVHNCDDLRPRGLMRRVGDWALDPVTDAYFGVARAQVPYLVEDLRHPVDKVRIIHNGVDPAGFDEPGDRSVRKELGFRDDEVVVGILAALRPEKDHETFLRAAGLVAAKHPGARFLVVGGGDRKRLLEDMAVDLGLAERVVFTGARDDVPALLAAIDVFVLSSFTIECFPMALLEAMASALPAVCTAVGGIPEMIEDGVTGYLVPARDPQALAVRVAELVTSAEKRRAFGSAARRRVETHFSLRRSVRNAEQQIVAVAAAAPRRTGPIRLAVVLDETFIGGVELLMLNLFRTFDPAVVVPRLICLRAPGPLAADFRDEGFSVEVMRNSGRCDPRRLLDLAASLRREGTDVVLVTHHHRAALVLGRLAARLTGVPNVIAVHDMDLTTIGKRCLPKWTVATLRETAALVLLAPLQGDYLHREEGVGRRWWSRAREVVVPNGVTVPPRRNEGDRSRARDELDLDADEFVVGIVARLSAQKAHHVLFAAFEELVRSHPRARLVVVGRGERDGELRGLAADLGINERVLFTGARRDAQDLMPAFDVACLSSVHEGAPLAVLECMAAGLPMVVTDCGALRDLVKDGELGYVVPVEDSPALADRLKRLADDPGLRERMGRAARAEVEHRYRIERTARGYELLLVDLVGAG
jgi:glycosyltransferase involved in cell wall biosynthesis